MPFYQQIRLGKPNACRGYSGRLGVHPFWEAVLVTSMPMLRRSLSIRLTATQWRSKRQLDVLDRHLVSRSYLCGGDYTIADIAIYPWYGVLVEGGLYDAAEFLDVKAYKHVLRWARTVSQRPAVKRGRRVNRVWGNEEAQLPERH